MTDEPDQIIPPGYVARLFDMTGRHAVVVGGASGLGAAIALGFGQAGAKVSIVDVNAKAAERIASQVRFSGASAVSYQADVTSRASLVAVAEDTGAPDVLVNSAGSYARHPAEDFPEDVYDRIISINLKGTFLACQVFGRLMLERGSGSIINLASIGASVAYPYSTAYVQSKGGVAQMTRSLALEWITRGVRVNAIAPSLFDTPLSRTSDNSSTPTNEFIMTRTPIGRRGKPEEVVGAAIFLASSASEMVTGHMLQVDGGYLTN